MSTRRTLILVGALVVGAVAALLIFRYVGGIEERAQGETQMVSVVIAKMAGTESTAKTRSARLMTTSARNSSDAARCGGSTHRPSAATIVAPSPNAPAQRAQADNQRAVAPHSRRSGALMRRPSRWTTTASDRPAARPSSTRRRGWPADARGGSVAGHRPRPWPARCAPASRPLRPRCVRSPARRPPAPRRGSRP